LGHFWLSYDGFTVISVRVWYVWSVFSSSLNQYWQSTISDKHYSNRLVKSYSKRYGVSDLSHFWLSYDGFTVILLDLVYLIRFFVLAQSILTIYHIKQTLFESSCQELLRKVWCFRFESFLIEL
jgi:hypothetical protein